MEITPLHLFLIIMNIIILKWIIWYVCTWGSNIINILTCVYIHFLMIHSYAFLDVEENSFFIFVFSFYHSDIKLLCPMSSHSINLVYFFILLFSYVHHHHLYAITFIMIMYLNNIDALYFSITTRRSLTPCFMLTAFS